MRVSDYDWTKCDGRAILKPAANGALKEDGTNDFQLGLDAKKEITKIHSHMSGGQE